MFTSKWLKTPGTWRLTRPGGREKMPERMRLAAEKLPPMRRREGVTQLQVLEVQTNPTETHDMMMRLYDLESMHVSLVHFFLLFFLITMFF